MLASNSKLTPAEKLILKDYRALQMGSTVLYRNFDTTVLAKFGPTVVTFSTSVRSPNETKNRNKVGEYRARSRFENGEVSILNVGDFMAVMDVLEFQEIVKKNQDVDKIMWD